LAYPTPSMAFGRCRPGPSRFSRLFRLPRPKPRNGGPHELGLSFRALAKALETPLGGSSSHGIRRVPLRRHAPCASTPGGRSLRRTDGASRQSRSALVVSHHLDGFLRAKGCGFVAPRCQPGVRRVSCLPPPASPEGDKRGSGTVPATRFTPFEEFPSSAAVPHHCGRCLLAVTVRRSAAKSGRSRSVHPTAPDRSRSRNPLAWLPRETAGRDAGRAYDAVMLRSAEADPHVTGARLPASGRGRAP